MTDAEREAADQALAYVRNAAAETRATAEKLRRDDAPGYLIDALTASADLMAATADDLDAELRRS